MKLRFLFPVTLALTILVWMVLSWPLPRFVADGIPASPHSEGRHQVRSMFPGDHLQLLYNFALFDSMFRGETPWFYNLYEFNTGNDAERFQPSGYYFPFSLVYSLGKGLGGISFGYNLSILFAMWGTVLGMWFFIRRYVADPWVAIFFAVFTIAFPFSWKSLLDGSPTGFSMMWIPLLLLGLDMAVKEKRVLGGVLAGLALFFCFFGSSQVFYFSLLITPAWCLLVFFTSDGFRWRELRSYTKTGLALFPAVILSLAAIAMSRLLAKDLAASKMEAGRSIREVGLFSPRMDGLFTWLSSDISSQVFLGYVITMLIILGAVVHGYYFLKNPRERAHSFLFHCLLIAGCTLIVFLSLGPNGPLGGIFFHLARKWIPYYDMLRQPGKIYCLMPTVLALTGAISFNQLLVHFVKEKWRLVFVGIMASLVLIEYVPLSRPAISLIDEENSAYYAISEDARHRREIPRMLVVVLWPGDSHDSSLYQFYAIRYGIRMVNGYSPVVGREYYQSIFRRFISLNHGYLSDDQADELLDRGIQYIALHEDMFPEKVSPFPVTYTLKHFLNHPRLIFLKQFERVWAFRILEEHQTKKEDIAGGWEMFFPARHWEMEKARIQDSGVHVDASASGGAYVGFDQTSASLWLNSTNTPPAPELRWMIRARGRGLIILTIYEGRQNVVHVNQLVVDEPEWIWIESPIPLDRFAQVSLRIDLHKGDVDLDSALLAAGKWPQMSTPFSSLAIPAPCLFHAGYTDLEHDEVVLLMDHDDKGPIVLYGPKMPLAPNEYEVLFRFSSNAPDGTELGMLHLEPANVSGHVRIPVVAGLQAKGCFVQESNLPFLMTFVYSRHADMRVQEVVIRPIGQPATLRERSKDIGESEASIQGNVLTVP